MKFMLKKELFLKPKQICILQTKKPQKEKKKWKEKKWTKVPVQLKTNHIEKFETQNLRRVTATLVLVKDTEVMKKEEGKM